MQSMTARAHHDTRRKQLWRERNSAQPEAHARQEAVALAAGVSLAQLRTPAVLVYDVSRFPLQQIVLDCLGLSTAGGEPQGEPQGEPHAQLEGLRATPGGAFAGDPRHQRKYRGGDRGPSSHWVQRWLSEAAEFRKPHAAFTEAYLRLLRECILPHIGDASGMLFQKRPTFRCHVHGGGEATGCMHKDVDNGHPATEVNFWLPLTTVFGSNSLFAESAPGKGDFAPFCLGYGEIQRFWGAECMHHTLPNESGATRVSVDFRVVPRCIFVAPADGAGTGATPGKQAHDPYRLGEFYGVMDGAGVVVG